jgi:DDB1- and CUL4-associated factor 15
VNLFDDHGAEDIKCVTMTQWHTMTDSRVLIVHGSSEIDDQHSFLSIVRVPTIGCLSCKKLRENDPSDQPFKSIDLCMKCNLTIHTKYRFNESTQKFEPKIHLNAPGFIIMCENSLIHVLSVKEDMQKMKKQGCNIISHKYLKSPRYESVEKNVAEGPGQNDNKVVNNDKSDKSPPDDVPPKNISIVEQILADFSEYDVAECPSPSPFKTSSSLVMLKGCESLIKTPKASVIPKCVESGESSTSQQPKPPSPQSPELLEAAAKTYEFSEENEKCEKISLFRKRRLADKKYEFNEENTENIIPFNRTRSRTLRRPIYQHRTSPHPSFRSPCGSPVAQFMSPPTGFRSPSYYAYRSSPTHHMLYSPPTRNIMRMSGSLSPAAAVDDVHKYFSDIMNRMKDNRVESGNESSHEDIKPMGKDFPAFSKKIINYYVEEDDANSVVTCEEDDCISPGYHLSLPMEVHGACYSKMQIVSKASLSRLKGVPKAIITQNSFDIETFSIHIANKLCTKNSKKYGILFDLAFEIVHVCPLSQTLLCVLILQFTGSDFDRLSKCFNCSNDSDCFAHRKLFESTVLFTWKMCGNEWKVLDYGQLKQLSGQMRLAHPIRGNRQEMLIRKLQRFVKKIFRKDRTEVCNFDHLRILDSNEEKSKDSLMDATNGIEFYRRQPFESPSTVSSLSSNSSASSSDSESCDELQH